MRGQAGPARSGDPACLELLDQYKIWLKICVPHTWCTVIELTGDDSLCAGAAGLFQQQSEMQYLASLTLLDGVAAEFHDVRSQSRAAGGKNIFGSRWCERIERIEEEALDVTPTCGESMAPGQLAWDAAAHATRGLATPGAACTMANCVALIRRPCLTPRP